MRITSHESRITNYESQVTIEDMDKIFGINSDDEFRKYALEIFQFQYDHNPVYHEFVLLLGRNPEKIKSIEQIPFLPIEFFKSHEVMVKDKKPGVTFLSSGTTGQTRSRHLVSDVSIYQKSILKGFEHMYGPVEEFTILALLPSYLEQGDSSLIYMVKFLMDKSAHPENEFFLYDHEKLQNTLISLEAKKQNTLLIGTPFSLLDFTEKNKLNLHNTLVMETGGMKGRRTEMTRAEVHEQLMKAFEIEQIHSEYGMTELLSQAYSKGKGLFHTPPWMKILIRDIYDPFNYVENRKTGGINVIDLANINSCSFIETKDLGKKHEDGSFEVLGRFDDSDVRGCSLMTG